MMAQRNPDLEHESDYATHLARINPGRTGQSAYLALTRYYDAELRPLLPHDREARIVDVGSGFGHLIRYLLENGYLKVGGVDSSAALLQQVRSYLGCAPDFLEHSDAIGFLQDRPGAFDLILLIDVIEHFDQAQHRSLVSAIWRALRPSGRVIIRTPNMANILGTYSRYIDLTHQAGFTEFSLVQLLEFAGFLAPTLHIPPPHGKWQRRLGTTVSRLLHYLLFRLQDRTMPSCFDKNCIIWADKT